MNELKEGKSFVDFTNLRLDSFSNVLKQHSADNIVHSEHLTILLDSKTSFESRLQLLE